MSLTLSQSILQEAENKKVKIQTTEAQRLEKILNNLFYLDKNIKKETDFIKHVMTRGQNDAERKGLHASAIIVSDSKFCLRQQVLSLLYHQLQGEQINVGLKRIFEEGNAIHEKWQRLFLRAGYSEITELDGTLYDKKYQLKYTPDAICYIPEFYNKPLICEIKSVNTFAYKNQKQHPSAYKQAQLYMHLTGIDKGFVLCEDKNTQDFKIEVYEYDYNIVKPFVERLEQIKNSYERVFTANKMPKRPHDTETQTCKRCVSCPMRTACWSPKQAVRLDV